MWLLHSFEQHSALTAQVLPAVRQLGLSAWQVLPVQIPLQQSAACPHAWPSDTQTDRPQMPLLHASPQQSVGNVQPAPRG